MEQFTDLWESILQIVDVSLCVEYENNIIGLMIKYLDMTL